MPTYRLKDRCKHATQGLGEAFNAMAKRDARKLKALNVSQGSAGGYLLPPELVVNVEHWLAEHSIFGRYASCWKMTTDELQLPMVGLVTTSGHSPTFGGLQLNWSEDGSFGAVGADPSFGTLTLSARSMLGGTLRVNNQLLQDGGDSFADYLERLLTCALDWYVEKACIGGTGIAGQPTGLIYQGSTRTVTRSGGSLVALADITGMIAALLPASYDRAIWLANSGTIVKFAGITGYEVGPHIAHGSRIDDYDTEGPRIAGWLMGRPLFCTEKCPALNTTGDIILFDPMLCALGTRQLEVEVATHSRFSSNQAEFRVIWRGDFGSLVGNTATANDGSTTVGAAAVLS